MIGVGLKGWCCYCGKKLSLKTLTMEHLLPVSHGGSNGQLNLRDCCNTCNTWRANKTYKVWQQEILECIVVGYYKKKFWRKDLEIILENVKYWEYYVETAGEKLKKVKHPIF